METEATGTEPRRVTPRSTGFRRWWAALLAVCLVAVAAYVLVMKLGEAQSRAARAAAPPPRGVPVVAVPARQGDVGVYLNCLGSVTPINPDTAKRHHSGALT